jgi:hypothetical protein
LFFLRVARLVTRVAALFEEEADLPRLVGEIFFSAI